MYMVNPLSTWATIWSYYTYSLHCRHQKVKKKLNMKTCIFWFNQIFRTWKQSTALLLAQLHENQHVWGNQNSQTELTCPLCPRGAAPNLCSAVACSARSDSSGSVGRRARPPTGLPRASCHSGPDETLGRWRGHREKNRGVGGGCHN